MRPWSWQRDQTGSTGFSKKALLKDINREQRVAARRKIADLREKVRAAMKRGPAARAEAKALCRAERVAAMERARAILARMREEAKALAKAEREGARWSCGARQRGPSVELAKLRQELEAEKRFQADMRRIERSQRHRRPGLAKAKERREESDDEVRQNIPSDLIPLFNRVRRSIKGSPRKSRTEAFLEYAEENPSEQYEGVEAQTDELIRELERQQRSGRRDVRRRRRVA